LILAVNGNRPLSAYWSALAPHGKCVVVGGALSQVIKTLLFGAFWSLGGKKMRLLNAKPGAKDLEFILTLIAEGKVKPVIDRQFPLEETAAAMRYLGQGHARGKVILRVAAA
jgi:NADPH:quinone reductase-like Zn-dependent oxidoreductase